MFSLDISTLAGDLGLIVVALIFALPIAWDREKHVRSAGLRTFPIVSMASCAFVLMSLGAFPEYPDAQARALQGLIAGIGFIGGGAILKDKDSGIIRGMTTAASIWNTAAIGAAVAFGRLELGLALSIVNFVILRWLSEMKPLVGKEEAA